jgi:DNA-directed RNA polymerase specialized sigma24 family protein
MSSLEMTNLGGDGEDFPSTNWRDLARLQKADQQLYLSLINHLITLYWKPVYCFLRKRGYADHTAKDLTQDFFYEVVLKKTFRKSGSKQGKLRTFLLKCLHHFTLNYHRRENTRKNHPDQPLLQLHGLEEPANLLKSPELSPEQAYHISWVQQLLQQSIQAAQQYCEQNGQTIHWKLFEAHYLFPIMDHSSKPSLKTLCTHYGLNDEKQASNMLTTVKRTLRRLFYEQMSVSLENPSDAETELKEIMKILE